MDQMYEAAGDACPSSIDRGVGWAKADTQTMSSPQRTRACRANNGRPDEKVCLLTEPDGTC